MPDIKMMTWNMQGGGSWGGAKQFLKTYEVICLQECGTLPKYINDNLTQDNTTKIQYASVSEKISGRDKTNYYVAYYSWQTDDDDREKENRRCSMAILSTIPWNTMQILPPPTHAETRRPVFGIQFTTSKIWAYCIHAPSGNPKAAREYTKYMVGEMSKNPKWFCAGDFNCDPASMGLELSTTLSSVSNSKKATQQSGGELDYVVHSFLATTSEVKRLDGKSSDHWPVQAELSF